MAQIATDVAKSAVPSELRQGRTPRQLEALERLFSRIGEVSSLPDAAIRVFQVARDRKAGSEDLLHVIEADPALALKILRTVNSAYHSLRHEVKDLKTAITLLGFKQVRNLALTLYVSRIFSRSGTYRRYSRQGLWNHHVAVASASRLIAEICECAPPDEAYLAGLLHDVGFILIDQHMNRYFRQVLDEISDGTATIVAEREILAFDHCELGHAVVRHWNLSEAIAAAAGYHHRPEAYEGPYAMIVRIVSVANYFCSHQGYTSLGVDNVAPPAPETYEDIGMRLDQVTSIIQRLEESFHFASVASAV